MVIFCHNFSCMTVIACQVFAIEEQQESYQICSFYKVHIARFRREGKNTTKGNSNRQQPRTLDLLFIRYVSFQPTRHSSCCSTRHTVMELRVLIGFLFACQLVLASGTPLQESPLRSVDRSAGWNPYPLTILDPELIGDSDSFCRMGGQRYFFNFWRLLDLPTVPQQVDEVCLGTHAHTFRNSADNNYDRPWADTE